jgi:hypothetical protein
LAITLCTVKSSKRSSRLIESASSTHRNDVLAAAPYAAIAETWTQAAVCVCSYFCSLFINLRSLKHALILELKQRLKSNFQRSVKAKQGKGVQQIEEPQTNT